MTMGCGFIDLPLKTEKEIVKNAKPTQVTLQPRPPTLR